MSRDGTQDFNKLLAIWQLVPNDSHNLPPIIKIHRILISHGFIVCTINISVTSIYYTACDSPWKIRLSNHNPGKNWKDSAINKTIRYDEPSHLRKTRVVLGNYLKWKRKHPNAIK